MSQCSLLLLLAQRLAVWNLLRPKTLLEQLQSVQPRLAESTKPKILRDKVIPPGQAMILGFLDETAPVIAYEDEASFLVQEFDGSARAKSIKEGTIIELPPKLLVRSLKVVQGSYAELTSIGTYALRYKYKGEDVSKNKLHQIEILEGPRKGHNWFVHEISLVAWEDTEEQQRHRDNTRREPGDLGCGPTDIASCFDVGRSFHQSVHSDTLIDTF